MAARSYTPKDPGDMNLMKLFQDYGSDEKCREYLAELRWPDGVVCPRCESASVAPVPSRDQYDCNACRYKFSVLAGTIFHDTKLPLSKWFAATYLMIESRKGISANQMKRTLNVSYKTAWYLCHRIRAAMGSVEREPLDGVIEADETFVGGKVRYPKSDAKITGEQRSARMKAAMDAKTVVLGAIERGGDVRIQVAQSRSRKDIAKFIGEHVAPDADAVYTDEWSGYRYLSEVIEHETVNHAEEEWVRGDVHSNSIESVWSLLKRSVVGSYHQLSVKHLDAYLGELEWRFNNRQNPYMFRDTMLTLIHSENLPYAELIKTAE